jgi:hypothetical protein
MQVVGGNKVGKGGVNMQGSRREASCPTCSLLQSSGLFPLLPFFQ